MMVLNNVPALIRMTLIFALVLFGIRKKLSLGNAFMLGAVAMSIIFFMPIGDTVRSIFLSIIYPKTLSLALVVSLILVLSSSMESTGQMQRLLAQFRGLVKSPRLNLVIFPALIGLLPMPGGAVFSAPMVKEMAKESTLTKDQQSYINYWFRHIWEYWWPMYPGVLLATLMADINLLTFVVMMLPLTLAAAYSGNFPVKELKRKKVKEKSAKRPPIGPFIHELMPILLVIVLGLGLGLLLSHYAPELSVSKELGLITSLLIAISWIWYENKLSAQKCGRIVFNMKILNIFYMVLAILVFKGILDDSQAVSAISKEMMQLHIPLFLIAVLLPFIVGIFTGITIAFVGSTFPILISLIHAHGQTMLMPAYIMIGLACGFAGVLLSPLHLCLLLSNEYFETSLNPVYRHLWLPCIFMITASMGYFWILDGLVF